MKIDRRAFLRLGLLGGITASAGVVYKQTEAVGLVNWLRWLGRGQSARLGPAARVAIMANLSYDNDLLRVLSELWALAKLPNLRGARVVIKPNLVDSTRASFTHPRVVEGLVKLARDEMGAASIVIAEGMTFHRDANAVLRETGYAEMMERQGIGFVDMNYDDLVSVALKGGYARMSKLFMARTVAEADMLISVPKLKTHHHTMVSASIKNLFGIVPGIKYGFPKNTLHIRGIPTFLAELLDSLPSAGRAAVVDGIVGMEGDGPLLGAPVEVGALVAGSDFLAVDATCARIMGFDPTAIDYMSFAAWAGLGQLDSGRIELVGAPLEVFKRRFKPALAG